jgi:hypothetical protein
MKKLIEAHKFFVAKSRGYVTNGSGRYTFRQIIKWPIAYIRFMGYAWKDAMAKKGA